MGVEESGGHSGTVLCARVEAREASWNAPIAAVREALVRAQTVVRGAAEANGGHDLDAAGTTVSAAFASAGQAFAAAVDAQLALAAVDWGAAGAVRAAIVVHTLAGADGGDPTGVAADSAARLLDAVHPGQMVLTERAADLARPDLIAGMALRPLGSGHVGAERLRLWQLTLPGLPAEFPPLTPSATAADHAAAARLRRRAIVPVQPVADESERAALRLRVQPVPIVNVPSGSAPDAAVPLSTGTARLRPERNGQPAADRLRGPADAARGTRGAAAPIPPQRLALYAVPRRGLHPLFLPTATAGVALLAAMALASGPAPGPDRLSALARSLRQPMAWQAAGSRSAYGESPAADVRDEASATAPGAPPALPEDADASGVAAAAPPVGPMVALIQSAAARWGIDGVRLLRIARCESELDPAAVNRHDGSLGLFQFQPGTWEEAAPGAGYAGRSPFDPEANVEVAAYLIARGEYWRWTCR